MGAGLRRARTATRESRSLLPSVAELADEVFREVEYDQGKGFVSDGLHALRTPAILFEIVRGHLWHSEEANKKMRAFLKKYGEMYPGPKA